MTRRSPLIAATVAVVAGVILWYALVVPRPRLVAPNGGIGPLEAKASAPKAGPIQFPSTVPEAQEIMAWVAEHRSGWSSTEATFKPEHTQLVSDTHGIEFDGDAILIRYLKEKGDEPESAVTVRRAPASADQAFWSSLIAKIQIAHRAQDPLLANGVPFGG
jgi:hypothetical protein